MYEGSTSIVDSFFIYEGCISDKNYTLKQARILHLVDDYPQNKI